MADFLDKRGHWVAIRQAVPGAKCSCMDSALGEPGRACDDCLGTGRAYVDRLIKIRKSKTLQINQAIGSERSSPIGNVNAFDVLMYTSYTVKPTQQDFILEIALDSKTREPNIPIKIVQVYNVIDIQDNRDQGGRVEYYSITSQRVVWPEFNVNG